MEEYLHNLPRTKPQREITSEVSTWSWAPKAFGGHMVQTTMLAVIGIGTLMRRPRPMLVRVGETSPIRIIRNKAKC